MSCLTVSDTAVITLAREIESENRIRLENANKGGNISGCDIGKMSWIMTKQGTPLKGGDIYWNIDRSILSLFSMLGNCSNRWIERARGSFRYWNCEGPMSIAQESSSSV